MWAVPRRSRGWSRQGREDESQNSLFSLSDRKNSGIERLGLFKPGDGRTEVFITLNRQPQLIYSIWKWSLKE